MSKKIAVLIILFLVCSFTLFAQGDNLTLKIAVMGPGNELYFWWGHIALMIEDSQTGTSYFFDYGIFSFTQDKFFTNFAMGRMLYRCGASRTESNFNVYRQNERSITIYTLDLPPQAKIAVRDFVMNNILPENRDYYYHHFFDNCSTRIRDIIDLAVDGQFKDEFAHEISDFTLRQHVRRHTWFSPAIDWILNFWMGQVIDTPLTIWDDMFLPAEVGKRIEDFWYTDNNGQKRKLVTSVEDIFTVENRHQILETPKKQWPEQLIFSLVLSGIFAFFFYLHTKNIRAGRILAGISMSFCGLVFGMAGLTLYFLNLFTNHDYTYENANMLFCTPLLLVVVPVGIFYAFTKKPGKQQIYSELLRIIWLLTVLGIFISMLIKLFPAFYQQNLTDQLLMLPIALTFVLQPVGLKEMLKKYFPRGENGS